MNIYTCGYRARKGIYRFGVLVRFERVVCVWLEVMNTVVLISVGVKNYVTNYRV